MYKNKWAESSSKGIMAPADILVGPNFPEL